jgi:uncharacterized protein (DUF58 family)
VVAPALGCALLLLVVADGLIAGRIRHLDVKVITDVEVGGEGWLEVHAGFGPGSRGAVRCALAADPRLMPDGRAEAALFALEGGLWHVAIGYRPARRGTGAIERLWLNWSGPLGRASMRRMWGKPCGSGPMLPRSAHRPCRPSSRTRCTG